MVKTLSAVTISEFLLIAKRATAQIGVMLISQNGKVLDSNCTCTCCISSSNNLTLLSVQEKFESEDFLVKRGTAFPFHKFVFRRLHFHWGSNDTDGSEHAINGRKYAAEIHFVSYNALYGNYSAAIKQPDGLGVVSLLIGVPIMCKQMRNYAVCVSSQVKKTAFTPMMNSLIYDGSLTTLPCFEIVTWVVLSNTIKIGRKQLGAFQQIKDFHGFKQKSVWRELQPVNER